MVYKVNHQDMSNAIRALSMDAIESANSGHPGLPLGMADVATVLFTKFLKFDAKDSQWFNRDRFVLSGGHGSMLLYSLLYLLGYKDITLDEIKNFRQLGSKTAGHPEYGHAEGIETTTGPLGQGIANAVGMAIAEKLLSEKFGKIINHKTYVMAGDGDLMEGISQETLSLAGHLKLKKLILLFDDNDISIDGPISKTDSTNQAERFKASGWNVIKIDGHNEKQIEEALRSANNSDAPTLICCKTIIGFGSPNKQGTSGVHGSPLGESEYKLTREKLNINYEPFKIPSNILDEWRKAGVRNMHERERWGEDLNTLTKEKKDLLYQHEKKEITNLVYENLYKLKANYMSDPKDIATRKSSELTLEVINSSSEITLGGSADLTGSNNTKTSNIQSIVPTNFGGRYLHYGIREHAMGGIMNGISLHGGFVPYGGTFLIFSDYCRPAIRLAALMQQQVIYVLTHDSIGLGEDGPTHQPIEHLASLRAIPNTYVFRPASAIETIECWELILKNKTSPSLIALSRQNLKEFRISDEKNYKVNFCDKGLYAAISNSDKPEYSIFASGSEVEIAIEVYQELLELGKTACVYSVPCLDLFNEQTQIFKNEITKKSKTNVVIEAGISQGWESIIKEDGIFIGMSSFGASGPYKSLYKKFNITKDYIMDRIKKSN
ncbi:MAG: transketolase [Hyphomicrobiales bacterium]|nr:transketolase [Hyphomicrobiales bacterium]